MKNTGIKGIPELIVSEINEQENNIKIVESFLSWFENQANILVMMIGLSQFDSELEEISNFSDSFSFNKCLRILLILNQITKSEFDEFNEIDKIRNELVNNIYEKNFSREKIRNKNKQIDKVFKVGLDKFYFFTRKSDVV